MNHRPIDFRLWLQAELYAEAADRLESSTNWAARIRTVRLSELEAVALIILACDFETSSPDYDSSTHDIAHHLASVLLSRLASEP